MASWKRRLLKRAAILCLLIALIFIGSRYGPQPASVLELFGEEVGELESFYSSKARIRRFLLSLGPYSSAVFILVQALQVVASPIPGELTGVVGGYIYGKAFAFILSTLGLSLGSWVAFELARILGRPFVERIVTKRFSDRFHFLSSKAGTAICFLFFALPGFPKDAFCYILGLSPMKLGTFLVVSIVGRMPGTYLLSVQGSSIRSHHYFTAALLAAFLAAILLAAYLYRSVLFDWVKRKNRDKSLRE